MKLLLLLLSLPSLLFSNLLSSKEETIKSEVVTKKPCNTTFTNTTWKLDEIRFVQDNNSYYYKKGDAKHDHTMTNDYIIFYESGKGSYHQSTGEDFELEWKQDNKEQVSFTIYAFRSGKDLAITWEHIRLDEDKLSYSEHYIHANGIKSQAYAIRSSECSGMYVRK